MTSVTQTDDQVVRLHLSCGLETTPDWVIYNEFVLTTANVSLLSPLHRSIYADIQFIRTVTEVRPEWLLEYSPQYFDPSTFPEKSETRRALERVVAKKSGKVPTNGVDKKKKRKDRA
jgi:pre-mRNA-splicing factor ATP-dependent RNA helicase DHX15/PRP43